MWVDQLPQLATAAVLLALAAVLLTLGPYHRANRVFSAILVLRGLLSVTYSFGLIAHEPVAARFWWRLFPVGLFLLPFVTLYFALVYPRPRGRWGRSRRGLALFLAPGVLIALLYFADPRLFWDLDAAGTSPLGPEFDAPAGPLFLFDVLIEVCYAVLAYVFARDYVTTPPATRRASPLLVSFGLSVGVLYNVASLLLFGGPLLWRHPATLSVAMTASLALAAAVVLGVAGYLAVHARRHPAPALRAPMRTYLALLPAPLLSVAAIYALARSAGGVPWEVPVLAGLWRVALPLLVAYALVRHQLFDLDLRLKAFLRRAFIVAPFAVAFFLASQVLQLYLPVHGFVLGLAATALIVLALRPIQAMADRVANRLLPNVTADQDYVRSRKADTYRETLEALMADGVLSPDERAVLDRLRRRLGLTEGEAAGIEAEAPAVLGKVGPGGPLPAARSRERREGERDG